MANRSTILFTSPLNEQQIQFAANNGLDVDIVQFVESKANTDPALNDKIKGLVKKNIIAIFTSQSSLNIVSEHLENTNPDWKIACTAPQTSEKVRNIFGENKIIALGSSANDLAQQLSKAAFKKEYFVFFSGGDRKDEIPVIMKKYYPSQWEEILVYTNNIHEISIEKKYDGIAFCSPSAVNAYFAKNKASKQTYFFAIGHSTASTLNEKGIENIIISETPDKNNMLLEIVKTFN